MNEYNSYLMAADCGVPQGSVLQGFPQVLRTWGEGGGGALQNLMGVEGLKPIHEGACLKYCQKIIVKELI